MTVSIEINDLRMCGEQEKDGQVSEQEFVEYYSNISANIDDDAYFEQMMRSSWNVRDHISCLNDVA